MCQIRLSESLATRADLCYKHICKYAEDTSLQPLRGRSLFLVIAPVAYDLQNWDQTLAAVCQRILNPHWHFGKNLPVDVLVLL